uniref:Putative structural protein n=1 Tax=viral metagenome TaxID=1070528 RepID=A0A6M3KQ22_9ZZZZ
MADQAVSLLDDLVREELPRMLVEIEPEIAPMMDKIIRTSFGVKSQEGLGKGYQVIHIYETGTAGLFESGDPLGPAMTSISGNQAQLLAEGSAADGLAIFPSATEVPHSGEIKRVLTLHKVVGNYSIPAAWKQLDMLNAMQLKKVARDLKAVAKQKALYVATSLMSYSVTNSSNFTNQVLGRISAIEENQDGWTDYIDITIDEEYGRIANFRPGQRLDLVADSDGVLQCGAVAGSDIRNMEYGTSNYVHLIVVDVDYLGKRITLRPVDSVDGGLPNYGASQSGDVFATAAAENDWIVYAKTTRYTTASRPQHSWGFNDWMKAEGTILGGANEASGLDLDNYRLFKSQVKAVNGPLTDDVINGYIAGYLDAYPGETLDTIITTQGVQQKWLQQPGLYNNRQNYERTGKALRFRGGWSEISYEFGGRVFDWIMSPMCLSKRLYAMKFGGDNIKRYGPPRIGGVNATMGPELEFLATTTGNPGVFMVSYSDGGAPQDLLEAPFWYYELICPVDPRGVLLTGLNEATML